MNSWDCFDTLIARRFCHPHSVFSCVGKKIGNPNFLEMRISAEADSDQTYEGIYKNLPNIDPQIEMQIELEHCFPIVENINKVEDGDLIISDMYHSAEFVERLLRNCGLKKDVNFIVKPNGKGSGEVWKSIKGIDIHTGDNIHSDINMANANGIKTSHYTECFFTPAENHVMKTDYILACWMRYIRLSFPYSTQHEKNLWFDQSQYNMPSLLLCSFELPVEKEIAFNFRDCVYWKPLYEILTGKKSREFHSSRKFYKEANDEYKNYAFKQTEGCIVVDLQGSGVSFGNFFGKDREIIYLAGAAKTSITKDICDAIEKHNCYKQGTLIGWNKNGPVRDVCEHDQIVVQTQSKASEVANNSINLFKKFKKDLDLLKFLVRKMESSYTNLNVKHFIFHN